MKLKLASLVALVVLVATGFAGKPHKARGKTPPQQDAATQPQLSVAPPAAAQPPSVRLGQFLAARLDQILAPLDQQVALPRTELMQLRQSFVDQGTKAPQPENALYQSALSVCDAISAAMDEREKAAATFRNASNTPGIQEVHDTTVRLPRHGRGSGKAARAAMHQERYENQQHQAEAAQKGAFLSSHYLKQWGDRSIVLRQHIQQLSSRERDAERAIEEARSAKPPAAPSATPESDS